MSKRTKEELQLLQALPLEVKIKKTQQRIREWVKYMVREVIESNKDQIIKGAISELSRNLSKTKAVKDAMARELE